MNYGGRNKYQGRNFGKKESSEGGRKYKLSGEKFVNPYDFVSFKKSRVEQSRKKAPVEMNADLHMGYMQCRIITRTPLAIPDTKERFQNPGDPDGHYQYPFMRIGDRKVIPGSSIRGSLRSVYEAVTDSCMRTAADEQITRRVKPGKYFSPAVLIRREDRWHLYQAEKCKLQNQLDGTPSDNKVRLKGGRTICWGEKVSGEVTGSGTKKSFQIADYGRSDGYVFVGEPFGSKNAKVKIFICGSEISTDTNNVLNMLDSEIAVYQDPAINRNLNTSPEQEKKAAREERHSGYCGYEQAKENGIIPIWYRKEKENNMLYVSPASIGRKTYQKSMHQLVGTPCSDRNALCPACTLFGMIGGNDSAGYGSRVRVTDAICVEGKDAQTTLVTLKELGKPRISYLPFYSEKGKSYDERGAEVRGRKLYWHHPTAATDPSQYETREKTKRNATMELQNPGSEFTFRLYFDGITNQELQELEWLVTLGDNKADSNMCHHIGHCRENRLNCIRRIFPFGYPGKSFRQNFIISL